jgi:hypothetical protein
MNQNGPEGALKEWTMAVASADVDRITDLYHKEAVLWGTLSPVIRNTPGLIREYFLNFASQEEIKGKITYKDTRLYGNIGIISGAYTFTWKDGGKLIKVPARFSFVYEQLDNRWLIVDHHSSVVPESPFPVENFMVD